MFIVMLIYLAMAVPVSGSVHASLSTRQGEALVCLRIAGFDLMKYTGLFDQNTDHEISVQEILMRLKEKRESTGSQHQKRSRRIKRFLLQCASVNEININASVGLGEAWSTALAAGSIRAVLFSAFSFLRIAEHTAVYVVPDFSSAGFCVHLRCIFSLSAGDVMFSAIKEALKRAAGKENVHAAASH